MNSPKSSKRLLINPLKLSIYRIDKKGSIIYVNTALTNKTCCNVNELIGKNHSVLKHNEMPIVIQNMITTNLNKNNVYFSVNKNCSKNKLEFWTLNYYKPIINEGYEVKMIKLPKRIKTIFIKFYNKLNKMEQNSGIKTAEKFLQGFFEYKKVKNFQEFIFNIYGINYKKKYRDNNQTIKKFNKNRTIHLNYE